MKQQKDASRLVEIWGDVVDVASTVKATLIAILLTMGLYFLAPRNSRPLQLALGMTGAVLAFAINSRFIRPKHTLDEKEDTDGAGV